MQGTEQRIAFGLSAFFSLLSLGVALWMSDRGFDITDEAYYLLLALHPDAVTMYISAQQWVLAPIWSLTGSLAAFRIAGVAILVLSAGVFVIGTLRLFAMAGWVAKRPGSLTQLGMAGPAVAAALLYGTTINFSPSYNLIAAAGSYLALGAIFAGYCSNSAVAKGVLAALGALVLAATFVCKPPVAPAVLVIAGLAVWAASGRFIASFLYITFVAALAVLATYALAVLHGDLSHISTELAAGLEVFRMVQSEAVGSRLVRYAVDFSGSFGQMLFRFALFLLPAMMALWLWHRPSSSERAAGRYAIVAGVLWCALVAWRGHWIGAQAEGHARFETQLQPLMAIALVSAMALCFARPFSLYRMVVIFLLAAAPYAVAVGTGNALFTQAIVSPAAWGVLVTLAVLQPGPLITRRFHAAMAALFTLVATVQLASSVTQTAYHLDGSLIAQTERTEIGALGKVRLSPATQDFVHNLQKAAKSCSLSSGQPVFALYNVPGVSLVLDAVPPISPWINNLVQADVFLDAALSEARSNAIFAIRKHGDGRVPENLPERVAAALPVLSHCGDAVYPFQDQHIQIFAPIAQ